jgi:hypothetical protein
MIVKSKEAGPSAIENADLLEEIGGELNTTTDFTDRLFRTRDGRYFLEEERRVPFPLNSARPLPRRREALDLGQMTISVKEISERDAMKWFVTSFINDDQLEKKFLDLIRHTK